MAISRRWSRRSISGARSTVTIGPRRLLKSKIQRSFQRDGQKYQVRGLEVDKDGQLLVTDKRILLIHAGTTSIPIAKVLHVEVDWDRSLITLTKDGAEKPVLLTTPRAAEAGAIIAQMSVAAEAVEGDD